MRRYLSLLLIAFLVLRGLVGTAMAAGMLPPAAITHSNAVAAQAGHHSDHGNHGVDMASHASHGCAHDHKSEDHASCTHEVSTAQTASASCSDGHGGTCAACEICHSFVLLPAAVAPPQMPAPAAAMERTVQTPANAPLALAHKPPIA